MTDDDDLAWAESMGLTVRRPTQTAYPVVVYTESIGYRLDFVDFKATHMVVTDNREHALTTAGRILSTLLHSRLILGQTPPPPSTGLDHAEWVRPVDDDEQAIL